jgi:branched-subunit amino acid ABC-type transport system permease component
MQLVANGIVYGMIVALSTMGLTITTKILGFFNFAHGTAMTVCAYVAFALNVGLGWPFWLAAPVAVVVTALLAVVIDRLIYVRMRGARAVALLMASIGVTFSLRSLLRVIYGNEVRFFDVPLARGRHLPLGVTVTSRQIVIVVGSLVVMAAMHLFLTRTKVGMAMRGTAGNPMLAMVSGINPEVIYFWAWAIGTALAGLGGVFLALDTRLIPTMGWDILVPIFVAMVMGGIGSVYGAVLGGLIVGLAMEIAAGFIPPTYKLAVAFLLMIVVLLFKPMGLFAERK